MNNVRPEVRNIQFRKIKADPASHYERPDDVLADDRFEQTQKVDILRQWGRDLRKIGPGPAKGGAIDVELLMKQIAGALDTLGVDPADIPERP